MSGPAVRKLVLSVHLAVSVGWIGAVVVYLVLGIAAATSAEANTVRAAWVAMELSGWFAIVPLAAGSLMTGIVLALVTRWGLFRHYWVVFSLVLTVFAVGVLVLHMPTVSSTADLAGTAGPAELKRLGGDLAHPAIGLGVLVAILVLNIYKPPGLTAHGRRTQHHSS